jgi:hypothetical protein
MAVESGGGEGRPTATRSPFIPFSLTHLLQLFCNVSNLSCSKLPVGNEWAGAEGVHPVLVPQQVQQVAVQARLEEGDVKAIVLHAETVQYNTR